MEEGRKLNRRSFLQAGTALAGLSVMGGFLASCAPAAPAASAGGSAAAPAAASRTYRLWHWWPQDNYVRWFQSISKKFEDKYAGAKVELSVPSGDYTVKLKSGVAGGEAPDIASVGPTPLTIEIWKSGACLDLTDFYKNDKEWQRLTDLWPTVPETQKTYNGKLYGAVWSNNIICVWWWKDLLAELGAEIPTTLDELYALAPKAQEKNLSVLSAGFGPNSTFHPPIYYFTLESLYNKGGDKLWAAGHTGDGSWDQPELRQAMDAWGKLFQQKIFDPGVMEEEYGSGSNSAKNLFRDRKVLGFYHSGPWMIGYDYADPNNTLKQVGLEMFPRATADGEWSTLGSDDMCFSVFVVNDDQKDSDYQSRMVEFLKIGNSEEAQNMLFQEGITVAWSGALEQPVDNIQKQLVKDHITLVQKVKPDSVVERTLYVADMESALVEQMQSIALGQSGTDDAIKALEDARKRIFAS